MVEMTSCQMRWRCRITRIEWATRAILGLQKRPPVPQQTLRHQLRVSRSRPGARWRSGTRWSSLMHRRSVSDGY